MKAGRPKIRNDERFMAAVWVAVANELFNYHSSLTDPTYKEFGCKPELDPDTKKPIRAKDVSKACKALIVRQRRYAHKNHEARSGIVFRLSENQFYEVTDWEIMRQYWHAAESQRHNEAKYPHLYWRTRHLALRFERIKIRITEAERLQALRAKPKMPRGRPAKYPNVTNPIKRVAKKRPIDVVPPVLNWSK